MPELETLGEYIGRLLAWVDSLHPIPPWHSQLVLDTSDPMVRWVAEDGGFWQCPERALQPPDSFAGKFDELLRVGYAWINLSVYGIFDDDLIIGIELPSEPVGVPPGRTSVNFSGPSLGVTSGHPAWQAPLVKIANR